MFIKRDIAPLLPFITNLISISQELIRCWYYLHKF